VLELTKSKPVFKPGFKSVPKPVEETITQEIKSEEIAIEIPKPKPVFKPSFKPATKPDAITETPDVKTDEVAKEKPKSGFKPTMKITPKIKD
jgi:NADH-quinone oxidoreductase subunit I